MPLLIRQGLSWASFLASSEIFKNKMKEYRGLSQSDKLSANDLFLVSFPVAIINTVFIMPMDCIKTFYQNYEKIAQKKGLSFFKFTRNSIEMYSPRGLYLGWQARIIQYLIQSVFTLIVI